MVEVLVDHGCDVNAVTHKNETALNMAIFWGLSLNKLSELISIINS